MNLEQLLSRIKEIEVAITNATAQLNAAHGHKSEIQHWIKILENQEKTPILDIDEQNKVE